MILRELVLNTSGRKGAGQACCIHGGIALLLQSVRPVAAVAELGPLRVAPRAK